MTDWFKVWFDTDYYHLLYNYRDEREAEQFISRLCSNIQIPSSAHIIDLACGRGRHARILARHCSMVTGIDISASSIEYAIAQETPGTQYFVQDMRQAYGYQVCEAVFNLFTSFGYFDTLEEHELTLYHVYNALKPGGIFVFDFLNPVPVRSGITPSEHLTIEGIRFDISRYIEDQKVIKEIVVHDRGRIHTFFERVQLFDATLLQKLFRKVGFRISSLFGDIQLSKFEENSSPRIILIAKKP
ncbi:class I SAM-dependent DNA methyltransferase [Schleiferia thermophila]|uniref:class I SAM-dependent DNA methyltransferase n=1 Tax=Schleiferia thermophila TaxID=884107 RepID=UPI003EEAAFD9